MIGIILINAAAEYIVFPLSFTSLSDLSAPSYYPPWTHCTLTQIPSGQSSCCCKPKVNMLKWHDRGPVCLCPHPPTHLTWYRESEKTLTAPSRAYKGAPSFLLHLLLNHHVPSPSGRPGPLAWRPSWHWRCTNHGWSCICQLHAHYNRISVRFPWYSNWSWSPWFHPFRHRHH